LITQSIKVTGIGVVLAVACYMDWVIKECGDWLTTSRIARQENILSDITLF
jgi:hypothetical protein